jgi:multiple sugar transport system permease protein
VTLKYVCFSVPPLVLIALGLAVFLNAQALGTWPRLIFRTLFLLPAALAITVVATIGRWMLLYDNGLFNHALVALGLDRVPWLTSQPGAWISIVCVTVWCTVAWNMILLSVSLQNIPKSTYEAARIDGADGFQTFWHISLPSIRPMLFFVTVVQVIASFNLFAQPQLMTGGGPERSTTPVMMFIYVDTFNAVHPRIGNGCAMAFATGLIMLTFVLLQYRLVMRSRD